MDVSSAKILIFEWSFFEYSMIKFCSLYEFSVDLSLYKNESQIEKKAHGKRKAPASGKKTSPAAKKQKIDTPKVRATPAAKAKSSAKTNVRRFSFISFNSNKCNQYNC